MPAEANQAQFTKPIQFGGWIKTSQVESGPASRADGQAQGKDVFALINQKKKKSIQ